MVFDGIFHEIYEILSLNRGFLSKAYIVLATHGQVSLTMAAIGGLDLPNHLHVRRSTYELVGAATALLNVERIPCVADFFDLWNQSCVRCRTKFEIR